jgi:hypothetical protein
MHIKLADGTIEEMDDAVAVKLIRARKATEVDAPKPVTRPAAPEPTPGYDGSWESAIFPRATAGEPGSFAAKFAGDALSLPFRALATLPALADGETVGESMARTKGRPDEPGWMQGLDELVRDPVNAFLPAAGRAGGALVKAAGRPASVLGTAALASLPASLAIAGGNQAENMAEGRPVSLSEAALDAAIAEALGTGIGGILGKGSQMLGSRRAAAMDRAEQARKPVLSSRSVDLEEGFLPAITPDGAPMAGEIVPPSTVAQIRRAERDLPFAERKQAEARDAFMRMMKFLPGKSNRGIWEAAFRQASNPAYLDELLRGAETVPDIVANAQAGVAARAEGPRAIMTHLDASGKRVPVDDLVQAGLDHLLKLRTGSAKPAEINRAVRDLEQLMRTPEPGQRAIYAAPDEFGFSTSPSASGDFPLNARESYLPSQARELKTTLQGRAKYNAPDANVKQELAKAVARKARETIESLDETGTLGAKNRELGDWLAPMEGYLRAESRDANRDSRSLWSQYLQKISPPTESPQGVRRTLQVASAADKVGAAGRALGSSRFLQTAPVAQVDATPIRNAIEYAMRFQTRGRGDFPARSDSTRFADGER